MNIDDAFFKERLFIGRQISPYKIAPPNNKCVWNANVITRRLGKVWYGDLNLTTEGHILRRIALTLGEPLYVLKEKDARFGTESNPIDTLIEKAVWNTESEIPSAAKH
jgi:hypothetical protein